MKTTFEEIYNTTLEVLNIKREDFEKQSRSRIAPIVRARQIMCYIARLVGYSSTHIAKSFCMCHASILYHAKKAKEHIEYESDYAESVSLVLMELGLSLRQFRCTGWIVREKKASCLCFVTGGKPLRHEKDGMWILEDGVMYDIPADFFPQVTWDSEPQECEMTVKLK